MFRCHMILYASQLHPQAGARSPVVAVASDVKAAMVAIGSFDDIPKVATAGPRIILKWH